MQPYNLIHSDVVIYQGRLCVCTVPEGTCSVSAERPQKYTGKK